MREERRKRKGQGSRDGEIVVQVISTMSQAEIIT